MKREEALKRSEQALHDLAKALEEGKSETLVVYLAMLARFHHYSFGNIMLIYQQFPDAAQVAGFHAWRKLGRFVRKGEKGIAILAPLLFKRQEEKDDSDSNSARVLRGFKVVHVFDVSQTEGDPLPEFASIQGDPGDHLEQVRALIEAEGIGLCYELIPGGAVGCSAGGEITVVPDLDPAEEFSVLVHELAHELLHRGERRGERSKSVRETEAEAVSFAVCSAIGLETTIRSSDYIQLYSGDVATLSESLDHIQKAATRILAFLEVPAMKPQLAG